MISKQVNIFDFATSELSHDAILCYILSLYDSSNVIEKHISRRLYYQMLGDEYRKSKDFNDFFNLTFVPNGNIEKNKKLKEGFITQQKQVEYKDDKSNNKKGYIDIFAELKIGSDEIQFVIEDKIEAYEHGNQLENYESKIREDFKNPKFVFVTVGLKSSSYLESINKRKEQWIIIDIDNLIKILGDGTQESYPSILNQYREYLKDYTSKTKSYAGDNKIDNWSSFARQGFFSFIESNYNEFSVQGWGYVPNLNGGFMGCWFRYSESYRHIKTSVSFVLYLQLELSDYENRIALKISFNDLNSRYDESDKARQEIRDLFIKKVEKNHNKGKFAKTRRSMGAYITIADIDLNGLNYVGVVEWIKNAIEEFNEIIKLDESDRNKIEPQ